MRNLYIFLTSLLMLCNVQLFAWTGTIPKLPIGMNLQSISYFIPGNVFTDVMKTSDFRLDWSTNLSSIPRDADGYPTVVPFPNQGTKIVRFIISNYYKGRYVVKYDGVGTLKVNVVSSTTSNGNLVINLTGVGETVVWIDITASTSGNHIRNIRILPEQYADGSPHPTFLSDFLDGIKPFHAFRFMDWQSTNSTSVKNWSERALPSNASQSSTTNKGICLEHCVELCNTLNIDGWFCVPHLATDDYIRNMARFLRDNVNSNLKIYIEYSNEIWNWQFSQSSWIVNNAPGSTNQYVIDSLKAVTPIASEHPEKDAFMMSRVFKLFNDEFGTAKTRLIKVAGVQHDWADNTQRVLKYLQTRGYKIMPDLVSPGGYFNFTEADHNKWNSMPVAQVTPDLILDAVMNVDYPAREAIFTDVNAGYANQYSVGYAVYEGGQHMQPYLQGNYAYNPAVWASQIHSKMFDMYMKNFATHVLPKVNCKIFMAFSYMGTRKSVYGSWGHLERMSQINADSIVMTAPKFNALLYSNIQKADSLRSPKMTGIVAPTNQVDVTLSSLTPGTTIYYSTTGVIPFTQKYTGPIRVANNSYIYAIASKTGYTHSAITKSLASATIGTNTDVTPNTTHLVTAYPNPANNQILMHGFSSEEPVQTIFFSSTGEMVKEIAMSGTNPTIDVTDLKSGLYFIAIKSKLYNEALKLNIIR